MPGKLISLSKDGRTQQEFPVVSLHVFIGSDSYCDLRIKHKEISAQHCLITAQKDKPALIRNLSRTSPTLVNGVEIGSKDVVLKDQDVISIRHRQFKWCYDQVEGPGVGSFIASNKGRKSWPLFKNKLVAVVPPQRRDEVREETTKKRRATLPGGNSGTPGRKPNKKVLAVKTGVKGARKSSLNKKSAAKTSPSLGSGTPYGSGARGRKSVKFVDTAFGRRLGKRKKESFGPPTPYRPSNTPGRAKESVYFTPPSTLGSSSKKPMKSILKTPASGSVRTQTQTPLPPPLPDLAVTPPPLPSISLPLSNQDQAEESGLQTPPREDIEPSEVVARWSKSSTSRAVPSPPDSTPKSASKPGKRMRQDQSIIASERAAKKLKQDPPRAIDKKKMAALLQCHRKSLTPHPEVTARRRIFLAPITQPSPKPKATSSRKSEPSQPPAGPRRVIFGSLDGSNARPSISKRKKTPFKPINMERKMSLPKSSVAKMTSTPSPPSRKMTRASRAARASRGEPRERGEVTDVLSALDLSRKFPPAEAASSTHAKVTASPIADFSGIKRLFSTDKTLDVRELFLEDSHETADSRKSTAESTGSRLSRRSSLKSTESILVDKSINSFNIEGVDELPASPPPALSLPGSAQSLSSTSRRSLTLKAARKSSLTSTELASPHQLPNLATPLISPKEGTSASTAPNTHLNLSNSRNSISLGPGSAFTPVRKRGRPSKGDSPQSAIISNAAVENNMSPGPLSSDNSNLQQEVVNNSSSDSLDFSLGSFDASRHKDGTISSSSPRNSSDTSSSPEVKPLVSSPMKTSRVSLRRIALKASTPKGLSKSLQLFKSGGGQKSNLSLHQLVVTSSEGKSPKSPESRSRNSRADEELLDENGSVSQDSQLNLLTVDKSGQSSSDNSLFVNVGSIRMFDSEESFGMSPAAPAHSKSLTSHFTPSNNIPISNFASTGKFAKKKFRSMLGQRTPLKHTRSKSSVNINLFDLDKRRLASSTPLKADKSLGGDSTVTLNTTASRKGKRSKSLTDASTKSVHKDSSVSSEQLGISEDGKERSVRASIKPTRSTSTVDIDLFKLDEQSSSSPDNKRNKSLKEASLQKSIISRSLSSSSTKSIGNDASVSKSVSFQHVPSARTTERKSTRSSSSVTIDLFKLDDDPSGLESSKARKSRRKLYEESLETSASLPRHSSILQSPARTKSAKKENVTILKGKRSKSMPSVNKSVTFSEEVLVGIARKSISEKNLSRVELRGNTSTASLLQKSGRGENVSSEGSSLGVVPLYEDYSLDEPIPSDSSFKLELSTSEDIPKSSESSPSPVKGRPSTKDLSVRSHKSKLALSSNSSSAKSTRSNSTVNIDLFGLDDDRKQPFSTSAKVGRTFTSPGAFSLLGNLANSSVREQKSFEKMNKKQQSKSLQNLTVGKSMGSVSFGDIDLSYLEESSVPEGLPTSTPAKPILQAVAPFVVNNTPNDSDLSKISFLSSGESSAAGSYVLPSGEESVKHRRKSKKWHSLIDTAPPKTTRSTASLNINLFGLDENPLDPTLLVSSLRSKHSLLATSQNIKGRSFKLLKRGKSLVENNRKAVLQPKSRSKSLTNSLRLDSSLIKLESVSDSIKSIERQNSLSQIENNKSNLSRKSQISTCDTFTISQESLNRSSRSGKDLSLNSEEGRTSSTNRESKHSPKNILGLANNSKNSVIADETSKSVDRILGSPKHSPKVSLRDSPKKPTRSSSTVNINLFDLDKKKSVTNIYCSPEAVANEKEKSLVSPRSNTKLKERLGSEVARRDEEVGEKHAASPVGRKAISKKLSMMKTTPKPKPTRNTYSLGSSLVTKNLAESEMEDVYFLKREVETLIVPSDSEENEESDLDKVSTPTKQFPSIHKFGIKRKPTPRIKPIRSSKSFGIISLVEDNVDPIAVLSSSEEEDGLEKNLSSVSNRSGKGKSMLESSRPTRSSSSVDINLFQLDKKGGKRSGSPSKADRERESFRKMNNVSPDKPARAVTTPFKPLSTSKISSTVNDSLLSNSSSHSKYIDNLFDSENNRQISVSSESEQGSFPLERSRSLDSKRIQKSKNKESLLETSRPTRSSSAVNINLFDLDKKDSRKKMDASRQKEKLVKVKPDVRNESLSQTITPKSTSRKISTVSNATPVSKMNRSSHSVGFVVDASSEEKDRDTSSFHDESFSPKSKKSRKSKEEVSRPTRSSSAVDINLFDLDKKAPRASRSPIKAERKSFSNQSKTEERELNPTTSRNRIPSPASPIKQFRISKKSSSLDDSNSTIKPSRSSNFVDISLSNLESNELLVASPSLNKGDTSVSLNTSNSQKSKMSRKSKNEQSISETARISTLCTSYAGSENNQSLTDLSSRNSGRNNESLNKKNDPSPRKSFKRKEQSFISPDSDNTNDYEDHVSLVGGRNSSKKYNSNENITPKTKPTRSSHALDIDLFSIDSGKTIEKVAKKYLDRSQSLDSNKSCQSKKDKSSLFKLTITPRSGSVVGYSTIRLDDEVLPTPLSEAGTASSRKRSSIVENTTPRIKLLKSPHNKRKSGGRKSSGARSEDNCKHTQTPMSADYDNHKHSQTATSQSQPLQVSRVSNNTSTPSSDHEQQAKALLSLKARRSLRQKEMDESDRTPGINLSDKTTPLSALSPKARRSLMKDTNHVVKETQTPLGRETKDQSQRLVPSISKSSQTPKLQISSTTPETESTNVEFNRSRRSQLSDISSPINNSTNIVRSKSRTPNDSVLKSSLSNSRSVSEVSTKGTPRSHDGHPSSNTTEDKCETNEVNSPLQVKEQGKAIGPKEPLRRGRSRNVSEKPVTNENLDDLSLAKSKTTGKRNRIGRAGADLSPLQKKPVKVTDEKEDKNARSGCFPIEDSTVGTSSPPKRKRGRKQIETLSGETQLETGVIRRNQSLEIKENKKKYAKGPLKSPPTSRRTRAGTKGDIPAVSKKVVQSTKDASEDGSGLKAVTSAKKLPPSGNKFISSPIVLDKIKKRRAAASKDDGASPSLTRKTRNNQQTYNRVTEPVIQKKAKRGKSPTSIESNVDAQPISPQEKAQEEKTSPSYKRKTRNAKQPNISPEKPLPSKNNTRNKVLKNKSLDKEINPEPQRSPVQGGKQPKVVAISVAERRPKNRPATIVTKAKKISIAPTGKGRKSVRSPVSRKGLRVTFKTSPPKRSAQGSEPPSKRGKTQLGSESSPSKKRGTRAKPQPSSESIAVAKSEPSPARRRGTRAKPLPSPAEEAKSVALKKGRAAKSQRPTTSPVTINEVEGSIIRKRGRPPKSEPSPLKKKADRPEPSVEVKGVGSVAPKRGRPAKSATSAKEEPKPENNVVGKRGRAAIPEPSSVKANEEPTDAESGVVSRRGRAGRSEPLPAKRKETQSNSEDNVASTRGRGGKARKAEGSPEKKRGARLKPVVSSPIIKKGAPVKAEGGKAISASVGKRKGPTTSDGPALPKRARPAKLEASSPPANKASKTKKPAETIQSPVVKRGRLAKQAASSPTAKKGKAAKIENVKPKPKSKSPEVKKNANLRTVMKASKGKVSAKVKGLTKLSASLIRGVANETSQFKLVESGKVPRKKAKK